MSMGTHVLHLLKYSHFTSFLLLPLRTTHFPPSHNLELLHVNNFNLMKPFETALHPRRAAPSQASPPGSPPGFLSLMPGFMVCDHRRSAKPPPALLSLSAPAQIDVYHYAESCYYKSRLRTTHCL